MAARKTTLRAVAEDEKPEPEAPKTPLTVEQAAATGDHRALLVAIRERIAQTVSDPRCPPRDLASLTRRLQDIAKEIDAIDLRTKEEGDDGDEHEDEALDAEAL